MDWAYRGGFQYELGKTFTEDVTPVCCDNSGDYNSGDCNSGCCNSGIFNSGNWNEARFLSV